MAEMIHGETIIQGPKLLGKSKTNNKNEEI